jgi:hypothetical protein
MEYKDLSEKIIGCAYTVYNKMVNYLVATGKPVGVILNFGETKVEVKRKVRDLRREMNSIKLSCPSC